MRRSVIGASIAIALVGCASTGQQSSEPKCPPATIASSQPSTHPIDPSDKMGNIRKLMALTPLRAMCLALFDQYQSILQKAAPGFPKDLWDSFKNDTVAQMLDMAIPLYDENFTAEEIAAFLEFYQQPAGQSVMNKMPTIAGNMAKVGADWGELLAGNAAAKWLEAHKATAASQTK